MFKKLAISAVAALALVPAASFAAVEGGHVEDIAFSYEGPFGTFDQNQLQRGLKVYTEVCSACHGLQYVSFRSLAEEGGVGFTEDQVRVYASGFEVYDDELEDFRPAIPSDHFPANTSVGAPDLSLMAKARAGFHGPYGTGLSQLFNGMGGGEYIYSLLTGYTGEEMEQAGTFLYENTAFPSGYISMGPPLSDEQVEFDDGHANDVHNMAEDVAAFLMWTAEPKMMARQHFGFLGVFFLTIFAVLLYLTNKKLWAPIKGKKTAL
ncbi:cytochrome c1 [Mesobacterium pallidum]|uniref:cytochrome c1 n=1 Tax=Mesobacterium pallidum TaxID=2872037 RepID=UPI001EE2AB22|nr:cytochrome c1 [Mesobacterium pallidum]